MSNLKREEFLFSDSKNAPGVKKVGESLKTVNIWCFSGFFTHKMVCSALIFKFHVQIGPVQNLSQGLFPDLEGLMVLFNLNFGKLGQEKRSSSDSFDLKRQDSAFSQIFQ